MKKLLSAVIDRFIREPKMLFLVDAAGALLTAFTLFFVLRNLPAYFKMPHAAMGYLSLWGCLLFLYSATCYLTVQKNWSSFIRPVAVANLLYCIVTLILLVVYYRMLTVPDFVYFLSELLLVAMLSYTELKAATALQVQRHNTSN